jgi:hypothetical protein
MVELKTKVNKASVKEFLNSVAEERRRKDSLQVLKLMQEVTKEKPQMWGTSIVGFGSYHYKSERSSQEGDWPMTGFSPRKQSLTIYIMPGFSEYKDLLKKLGAHTISGGSCIYIKDLSKVDTSVLKKIVGKSFVAMKKKYGSKSTK